MIVTQRAHDTQCFHCRPFHRWKSQGPEEGNSQYRAGASSQGLPPLREIIPGVEIRRGRDLSPARAGLDLESLLGQACSPRCRLGELLSSSETQEGREKKRLYRRAVLPLGVGVCDGRSGWTSLECAPRGEGSVAKRYRSRACDWVIYTLGLGSWMREDFQIGSETAELRCRCSPAGLWYCNKSPDC